MTDDPYDNNDDSDPYDDAFYHNDDDDPVPYDDPAPYDDPEPIPPAHPPILPPLSYADTHPSYTAVPCQRCGYNLTGIAIGSKCPECGASVDASLYAAGIGPANGFAIASMVVGIIALMSSCCCPAGFIGIVGLILGSIAMNQMNNGSYANASRGMAIAGLICSGIALLPALFWVVMVIAGGF